MGLYQRILVSLQESDLHVSVKQRAFVATRENEMASKPDNINVFCGSSPGAEPIYMALADELGTELARRGIGLVYGGGSSGLMGAVATAADRAGGRVLGVIPAALEPKELSGESIGELRVVDTMHERKAIMAEESDAFIAMPGGFGTLDELFEVITWVQLGIQTKSIGLLNIDGYFDPIVAWIDLAIEHGFVRPRHRDLIVVASEPAELLDQLIEHEPPIGLTRWMNLDQT
jgi:uncharacterized protein (TIGR00730 family)